MPCAHAPLCVLSALYVVLVLVLVLGLSQVVLMEMTHDAAGNALQSPLQFCVSNTHLFWDPEYADVKLWQTFMLVKELEKFTLHVRMTAQACVRLGLGLWLWLWLWLSTGCLFVYAAPLFCACL